MDRDDERHPKVEVELRLGAHLGARLRRGIDFDHQIRREGKKAPPLATARGKVVYAHEGVIRCEHGVRSLLKREAVSAA